MASRRQFITGIATTSTVAIAGCNGVTGRSPEQTAEQYYTAVKNQNIEKLNELVHPKATYYPINERHLDNLGSGEIDSVESINKISSEELAERNSQGERTLQDYKQAIKAEANVGEVTFVSVAIIQNGERNESPLPIAKDGSDWKVIF